MGMDCNLCRYAHDLYFNYTMQLEIQTESTMVQDLRLALIKEQFELFINRKLMLLKRELARKLY